MYALQQNTRLALYLLVALARTPDLLLTAIGFAAERGVTVHHVAKVLQRLCRAGYLEGLRGARGGHRLRREPQAIRMLEVVELFEGPAASDCTLRNDGTRCEVRPCSIHDVLEEIQTFAVRRLGAVTIADLAFGPLGRPSPPGPGVGKRLPLAKVR